MTQLKFNQKDKPKVKEKETIIRDLDKRDCVYEKRIQACAWILLTIGLCIIVTTFYLAVEEKSYETNTNNLIIGKRMSVDDNNINVKQIIFDEQIFEAGAGEGTEENRNASIIKYELLETITSKLSGCQEKSCQIACAHAKNVYSSLYDTMQTSSCSSIDVLILDRQDFPYRVVKNKWLPLNLAIREVIIRHVTLAKIKSDAFNAYIFVNTLLMSWSHLNVEIVESGALLGLHKLKYLTIDGHINVLEPSFFQPVQTTLTQLKLNANLHILGYQSFFGVSLMHKLEYLDLSANQFNGTLDKNFFICTPNLKYLIIVAGQLSHIAENTFENLSDKLTFVNLSKNLLTTLSPAAITPLLLMSKAATISLSENKWICDCEVEELAEFYRNFRLQFMDALYCKAPHSLYGVTIDEVDFKNCNVSSSSVEEMVEGKEVDVAEEHTHKYDNKNLSTESSNESGFLDSDEGTSTEVATIFRIHCINTDSSSASSVSSSSKSSEYEGVRGNWLQFPAPEHEFELYLNSDNNMVTVTVEKDSPLMIIWFSEQTYDETHVNAAPFDYTCMRYQAPSLVVGPLLDNTTYTFCLIPPHDNEISPFNCLPLHVPAKQQENIWISQDKKQFTIGMLCLIFLLSTIAGALVAYFGIKSHPDLLEGSKNVLIVKKPDQACYVSTISETEYQKQSSVKRKTASIGITPPPLRKQSSIKLTLSATPVRETPPPAFHMSVKDLSEDTLPVYALKDENYETPKIYGNEYTIEQRCVPNKYGMSPGSPPPLPKRNSNIPESPTVVINRFSSKFD